MTSEADTTSDPTIASASLVALVAKREEEMRGVKPATPPANSDATETSTTGQESGVQAEEVEAGGEKDAGEPEKGETGQSKKAADVEWAKSDALKRRLTPLIEAGHLDDELLDLVKSGVNAKEITRGANKKFETAAELVKKANAERDAYKERAERYDRLMEKGLIRDPAERAESQTDKDWLDMTPAERREYIRREAREELEAEKATQAKASESQTARVRQIEGWAEDHKASLNGTVSDEDYEAALKTTLTEMLEEDIDPCQVLTERGLARRVNRVLERQRDDKEVVSLRERVGESKRDAVRSARASSPAGVRTQVEKQYATPREKRIAETLARYPVRPD